MIKNDQQPGPVPGESAAGMPFRIDPIGYADVMDACGTERFGETLLALTSRIAPVEEIYLWYREPGGAPVEIAAASWLDDQRKRIAGYAGRFFRSDPIVERPREDGGFLKVVAAEEISFPEYRRICFERPFFAHKLTFGHKGPKRLMAFNLYLRASTDQPDRLIAGLSSIANVAMGSALRMLERNDPASVATRRAERLRTRHSALSVREAAVLARYGLAMSVAEIAADLGVSENSVATYRARGQAKLSPRSMPEYLAEISG